MRKTTYPKEKVEKEHRVFKTRKTPSKRHRARVRGWQHHHPLRCESWIPRTPKTGMNPSSSECQLWWFYLHVNLLPLNGQSLSRVCQVCRRCTAKNPRHPDAHNFSLWRQTRLSLWQAAAVKNAETLSALSSLKICQEPNSRVLRVVTTVSESSEPVAAVTTSAVAGFHSAAFAGSVYLSTVREEAGENK